MRGKNSSLILSSYYFFYFSLVGVYVIFMPKVLSDLGYTKTEVGIIYAAAPFMRFLLPFVFRYLIELTPNIFKLSLLMTFISTVLFMFSIDNFWLFLLSNLLFGASMGLSLPYAETISLKILKKEDYGKIRLWGSIGFMGISLWLGYVLSSPFEALIYLSSTALLTLIFGIQIVKLDKKIESTSKNEDSFTLSKYWAFWLSIFLMQVSFGGLYNFFTIYQSEHGISQEVISWMWSFGVICEIVMLYFQAPLLKRNLLNILQFATIITAFRWLLLFLYADSTIVIFASQSLHAISFALYHTAAITYVFSLYTQKKLAQQFFLGIAFGLGGSAGALLSGWIYGDYLFLVESIIAVLAFISLLIHQKRKRGI